MPRKPHASRISVATGNYMQSVGENCFSFTLQNHIIHTLQGSLSNRFYVFKLGPDLQSSTVYNAGIAGNRCPLENIL